MTVSQRLREMMAAKAWSKSPDEWDQLPVESRAEMIAVHELENRIEHYQTPESGAK